MIHGRMLDVLIYRYPMTSEGKKVSTELTSPLIMKPGRCAMEKKMLTTTTPLRLFPRFSCRNPLKKASSGSETARS